jgi:YggT family protein
LGTPPVFDKSRHLRRGVWAVKDGSGWPACASPRQLGAKRGSPFSYDRQAAIQPCRTERPMNPFLWLVYTIISLYIYILIAAAVLSWLIAFDVVNPRSPIVANFGEFLYRITEPALRPIRNVLPNLGGIDISPVILIIGLLFLKQLIFWL